MNKRIRQWLRACHMVEKIDPSVMAFVPETLVEGFTAKRMIICRKSQLEILKAKNGWQDDEVEVVI